MRLPRKKKKALRKDSNMITIERMEELRELFKDFHVVILPKECKIENVN